MGRKNAYLTTAIAIVLLASASAGTLPAMAQDASRKLAPVEHSDSSPDVQTAPDAGAAPDVETVPGAAAVFKVTIPTVEAKGSSIDSATLKKILAGDFVAHAKDLAKLNATSITIPEIDVSLQMNGAASAINYVYKDVEIAGVHNGIADTASVGSVEGGQAGTVSYKFGKFSIESFDIGGSLAFYGFVPSTDQTMKTMYKNLDFVGGNLTGPDFSCEVGSFHTDEFKARPLKTPLADLFKLLSSDQFKQQAQPSPEAIGKLLGFYADMFTAFESSPVVMQKLACNGKDDKGENVAVSMGPMTIGGFGHSQYPAIEAKDVSIDAGASGKLSLGDVTIKSTDLTSVLAALQSAPAAPSQSWFTDNARKLIPAFQGFAFNDLKLDAPDSDNPGQRIKATVADYDLSLGDYFAGIPTKISTTANHIVVDVPPASAGEDDSMKTLRDMGLTSLDVGFDFAMHRDAAAKTIVIDKAESHGEKLGSVDFASTIGNAGDDLFTADQNTILPIAMALTVKSAKIEAVDAGLADLIFQSAAKEQGTNAGAIRATLSGVVQGMVLGVLGDTPSGKAVGDAVGKFLGGAKSISISATANDPGGLTAVDLAAAQANPAALASKVTIEATTR